MSKKAKDDGRKKSLVVTRQWFVAKGYIRCPTFTKWKDVWDNERCMRILLPVATVFYMIDMIVDSKFFVSMSEREFKRCILSIIYAKDHPQLYNGELERMFIRDNKFNEEFREVYERSL